MTEFQRQLEYQHNAVSSNNNVYNVETWYYEKYGIEFAVLIKQEDTSFTKSAYRCIPNKNAEYMGFQANDDNDKVYTYGFTREALQSVLWDVMKNGYRLF